MCFAVSVICVFPPYLGRLVPESSQTPLLGPPQHGGGAIGVWVTVPDRGGWHRESEICPAATQNKHFILTRGEGNQKSHPKDSSLVPPLPSVFKQYKNCFICSVKMNFRALTKIFSFIIDKVVFSIMTSKKIGKNKLLLVPMMK